MKRFLAKRFLGFFLAVVMICGIFAVLPNAKMEVSAAVSVDGKWEYDPANGGKIIKYMGREKTIVIPGIIDNNPINTIGNGAFVNNNNLTSVTIPQTITAIESEAFQNCSKLTSAYFLHSDANAFYIGQNVFEGVKSNFRIIYREGANNFGAPIWYTNYGQSFPAYKINIPVSLDLEVDYSDETIQIIQPEAIYEYNPGILAGGNGYNDGDRVTFNCGGITFTATVAATGGAITGFYTFSPASGQTRVNAGSITAADVTPAGSGAEFDVNSIATRYDYELILDNGGIGYDIGNELVLELAGFIEFRVEVTAVGANGRIADFELLSQNYGDDSILLESPLTITQATGGNMNANFKVSSTAAHFDYSPNISNGNGGSGYNDGDTVTFGGANNDMFTATVAATGGAITGFYTLSPANGTEEITLNSSPAINTTPAGDGAVFSIASEFVDPITMPNIIFAQYNYAVEINGYMKYIEPVYSDTLDISSLIPENANRIVRIVFVRADASPDYSKRGINIFTPADIVSDIITLSPRLPRMNRRDIHVNYIDEVIEPTITSINQKYQFRTSFTKEWTDITFDGTQTIDIARFKVGGVIEIRRAGEGLNSAGQSIKIRISSKPKTPDINGISISSSGIIERVTKKMQFSTDPNRSLWNDIVDNNLTTAVANAAGAVSGGVIFVRIKATDRTMKSDFAAVVY